MNHNPVVFEMKNLRLVIGIVVILALVSSPVLAISKADLIAQYQPSIKPASTPSPSKIDIYVADLIAQYQVPSTSLDFRDIPLTTPDGGITFQPTAPTKPTPTPSPSKIDTDVFSPYGWWSDAIPALVPSYYEYSKFPAPTPTPEWTYELPANLDYAKVFA